MIDLFALALTHGLLALAAWRLMQRADLDRDPAKSEPAPEEPVQPRPGMRLP
jgi:hypothetical protein